MKRIGIQPAHYMQPLNPIVKLDKCFSLVNLGCEITTLKQVQEWENIS
jgi:hypothetical protein